MLIKWTVEKLQEEALKYNTRSEFSSRSKGAYLSAYRKNILDKICSHMPTSLNKPWSYGELKIEAMKYNTRYCFQKKSSGAYQAAYRRNILDIICLHMKEDKHLWSEDELAREALKYNKRSEFQIKNPGAYQSAYNKKILTDICKHMKFYRVKPYTFLEISQEALKYETRHDFQKNSPAYQAASKRKVLDIVCNHMKSHGGGSKKEKDLFGLIKLRYSEAQKLRDMKVKIANKSHIKGFDLDIYVPELRKGIEFDGEYYHSFEYMRKDPKKSKWSDYDIQNYHRLKDFWFASKGIQVLHIKEKDWNLDKETCIKRCLEFLER